VLVAQAAVFVLAVSLVPVLGRSHGLEGVGLAWLVSNGLVACAVTPATVRVLRRRTDSRTPPGATVLHDVPAGATAVGVPTPIITRTERRRSA
jgi:hypothetical protein